MKLEDRIKGKEATVAVVGLGYVGLPLAVDIADAGYNVIGIERLKHRRDMVNSGVSYIECLEQKELEAAVKAGRLRAVESYSEAKDADIFVIAVPTPIDEHKTPDISYVTAAAREIAKILRPDSLVVLESTTYPGTTEEVLKPILEETGLKAGKDFYLAHSPERVDPGNLRFRRIRDIPKVVGGVDPESTRVAVLFYSSFVRKVYPVSSAKAAEMTKLLENAFRLVNISFINEMAMLCEKMGLNVWEIVEAASTKPYGFMPFYPGPGLGGHCIPVDPFYLEWKAREYGFNLDFVLLAGRINDQMPMHVVSLVYELLNKQCKSINGAKILLLGIAYKKDVGDTRESPAYKVWEELEKRGGEVFYYDPLVPETRFRGRAVRSMENLFEAVSSADVVVILTDHSGIDYEKVAEVAKAVVDTRNAVKGIHPNVLKLGVGEKHGGGKG